MIPPVDKFVDQAISEGVLNFNLFDFSFIASNYTESTLNHYLSMSMRNEPVLTPVVYRALSLVYKFVMMITCKVKPYSFNEAVEAAEWSKSSGQPWVANGYKLAVQLLKGDPKNNLINRLDYLESYFNNPEPVLFQLLHKKEVLKKSKFVTYRNRFVVIVPKELYLAQMALFPAILEIQSVLNCFYGFLYMVAPEHGGWEILYNRLNTNVCYEMDLSNCDLSESRVFIKWFYSILGEMTSKQEYASKLCDLVLNRVTLLPNGHIVKVRSGNASGNAYTYVLNTMVNFSLLIASIMNQNSFTDEQLLNLLIRKQINMLVGGDDVVLSHQEIISFNPVLHEIFLSQFGFHTEVETHTRDTVAVLGRGFQKVNYHGLTLILPVPRRSKILMHLYYQLFSHRVNNIFSTYSKACAARIICFADRQLFEALDRFICYLKQLPEFNSIRKDPSKEDVLPMYLPERDIWSIFLPAEASSNAGLKLKFSDFENIFYS